MSCYTAGGRKWEEGKSALSTGVSLGTSASLQGRPQAQQSLINAEKVSSEGCVSVLKEKQDLEGNMPNFYQRLFLEEERCYREWSDPSINLIIISQSDMLFDTLKLHKLKYMNPRLKYYFLHRLYTIYILYTIFPFLKFTRVITTFKCSGDFLYYSKTAPLSQVIPIIMSMIIFVKILEKAVLMAGEHSERKGNSPNATLLSSTVSTGIGLMPLQSRVPRPWEQMTLSRLVSVINSVLQESVFPGGRFILPDTSVWSLQEAREPRSQAQWRSLALICLNVPGR